MLIYGQNTCEFLPCQPEAFRAIPCYTSGMYIISQTPGKRKYHKGSSPCGNCNLNHHKGCRPRLDNTLCTCTCKWATGMRVAVQDMQTTQEAHHGTIPSIEECITELAPRMYRVKLGDTLIIPPCRELTP